MKAQQASILPWYDKHTPSVTTDENDQEQNLITARLSHSERKHFTRTALAYPLLSVSCWARTVHASVAINENRALVKRKYEMASWHTVLL